MVTHDLAEAIVMGDEVIVLGPRPGRVTARVAVDSPRPRRAAFRLEPALVDLEKQVRQSLATLG